MARRRSIRSRRRRNTSRGSGSGAAVVVSTIAGLAFCINVGILHSRHYDDYWEPSTIRSNKMFVPHSILNTHEQTKGIPDAPEQEETTHRKTQSDEENSSLTNLLPDLQKALNHRNFNFTGIGEAQKRGLRGTDPSSFGLLHALNTHSSAESSCVVPQSTRLCAPEPTVNFLVTSGARSAGDFRLIVRNVVHWMNAEPELFKVHGKKKKGAVIWLIMPSASQRQFHSDPHYAARLTAWDENQQHPLRIVWTDAYLWEAVLQMDQIRQEEHHDGEPVVMVWLDGVALVQPAAGRIKQAIEKWRQQPHALVALSNHDESNTKLTTRFLSPANLIGGTDTVVVHPAEFLCWLSHPVLHPLRDKLFMDRGSHTVIWHTLTRVAIWTWFQTVAALLSHSGSSPFESTVSWSVAPTSLSTNDTEAMEHVWAFFGHGIPFVEEGSLPDCR